MTSHDQGLLELAACPFCGGTDVSTRYVRDGRQMACNGCGASVAPTYHGPAGDTLERAKRAWNTRALSAKCGVKVKALEKIELASRKDSLTDHERIQAIRTVVCAALGLGESSTSSDDDDRYSTFRKKVEELVFDPIQQGGRMEVEILSAVERVVAEAKEARWKPSDPTPAADREAVARDLGTLHQRALEAAQAFEDAASYEETMWTGWGDCVVPPYAEMRRVKAQQAVSALRDAQEIKADAILSTGAGR